ncbi:MAG: cytidylate kinase-like family protein [Ruminococcaceae bacterium]|nr:cytidylate kinase-like family protein [Oscillospiraceae bacterium]
MSEKLVITIGRQYGSGGREVGHKLAELLGCKCYDQDLIVMAAKRSGISEEALALADEQASSSLLYTLAMGASMIYTSTTPMAVPINDALFIAQSEIIRELSETETCVIVGRCADYILNEHKKKVNVFVQGDKPDRIKRIMERAGVSESEAKERMTKKDKKRSSYYNYYTGGKWGKPGNYNLVVSTSQIGIEGAAKIIYEYAKTLGYVD